MSSQKLVSHGKETRKAGGAIPRDNANQIDALNWPIIGLKHQVRV